jgi:DNA-binding NtrC family response regulator
MTTLLIVEDDPLLLATLVNMVRHEGYEAMTACTLASAKAQLESVDTIALILLDVWLEGQASFDVIDLALKFHPSTPLVVMSGGGGSLSIEVSSSLAHMKGVNAFIQKPIERTALVNKIREFI